MPWKWPSNLRIFGFRAYPRAIRMAPMVASVPLFAKRIVSAHGTASDTMSARREWYSVSPLQMTPTSSACRMAARMAGWSWPRKLAPLPVKKSMYSLPSTSQNRDPLPRAR